MSEASKFYLALRSIFTRSLDWVKSVVGQDVMTKLSELLNKRKLESNYRTLKPKSNLIDFCSNDYLGLASSHVFRKNILRTYSDQDLQAGATGARLISGNSKELEILEHKVAKFHRAESSLIFSAGYLANLALLSAIGTRSDTFFYDELSHASLKDGIRLSQAKAYSFKHNDLQDLERKQTHRRGEGYVVVESLYSMDGDFAPLQELSEFCALHGLKLIVDEAHTNGVFGKEGEGLVAELNLTEKVFARNLTFGKALGVQGAAIAGSKELCEYLINYSRPFIYSTSLSPYLVALISEAYNLLPGLEKERQALFANIRTFAELSRGNASNHGPIQLYKVAGNSDAKAKAEYMQSKGFDIRAVLSPTVRKGSERLRICIHSTNTEKEISELCGLLYE